VQHRAHNSNEVLKYTGEITFLHAAILCGRIRGVGLAGVVHFGAVAGFMNTGALEHAATLDMFPTRGHK
jgi:hypothetical protein